MAEEAEVTIRLDGRPAKAELKQLNKEAEKTAKTAGRGVGKRVMQGGNAFLMGAGLGAVAPSAIMGGAKGAISAGMGDIVGAQMGPLWELLKKGVFGEDALAAAANTTAVNRLATGGAMELLGSGKMTPTFRENLIRQKEFLKTREMNKLRGTQQMMTDPDFMPEGWGRSLMEALRDIQRFLDR